MFSSLLSKLISLKLFHNQSYLTTKKNESNVGEKIIKFNSFSINFHSVHSLISLIVYTLLCRRVKLDSKHLLYCLLRRNSKGFVIKVLYVNCFLVAWQPFVV